MRERERENERERETGRAGGWGGGEELVIEKYRKFQAVEINMNQLK